LITIFLSPAGPVISTLLSLRSGGASAARQSRPFSCCESLEKSGSAPESNCLCLSSLFFRSIFRVSENSRWRVLRYARASGVSMARNSSLMFPVITMPPSVSRDSMVCWDGEDRRI